MRSARVLRPPARAIANSDADVLDAYVLQTVLCGFNELLNDLHAPDLGNQACKDGRLVTQPSAYLEHAISGLWLQKDGHQRDYERL